MKKSALSLNEQVEVEEIGDFSKFNIEYVSERGLLRIKLPYTYFKFDGEGILKGLIINDIEAELENGLKEYTCHPKTLFITLFPSVDISKDLSDAFKTYFWFYRAVERGACIKHSGWFSVSHP